MANQRSLLTIVAQLTKVVIIYPFCVRLYGPRRVKQPTEQIAAALHAAPRGNDAPG